MKKVETGLWAFCTRESAKTNLATDSIICQGKQDMTYKNKTWMGMDLGSTFPSQLPKVRQVRMCCNLDIHGLCLGWALLFTMESPAPQDPRN